MKAFKDLSITSKRPKGEKLKIVNILNREIIITGLFINKSNIKTDTDCLTLEYIIDSEQHITFSGSKSLLEVAREILLNKDNFPFTTTIRKINNRYEFT